MATFGQNPRQVAWRIPQPGSWIQDMGEESTIKVVDVDKVDDARLFFVFWSVSGQTQWSVPSVAHKDKGKKSFGSSVRTAFTPLSSLRNETTQLTSAWTKMNSR